MEYLTALFYPAQLVLLAGAIQAAAMLFRNQVVLRAMFLGGTALYIVFYLTVMSPPLYEAALVSSILGLSTLYGLVSLLLDRSRILLNADQVPLFEAMGGIEPGAFRRLMRFGHHRILSEADTLTEEGRAPAKLYFVKSGTVTAEKGKLRFTLPTPLFIGEIAYMTGSPASATIRVGKGADLVEWRQELLRRETLRQPRLGLALDARLARDLAAKVAASVSPEVVTAAPEGATEPARDERGT